MRFILLFSLLFMFGHADSKKWYGIYTTDIIPTDGCKIVEAGTIQMQAISGRTFPNSKNFVGSSINDQLLKLQQSLVKVVKKAGFNAIVGYRETSDMGFNGYNGKSINGDWGYSEYRVKVMGVPVKVECSSGLF